MPIDCFSKCRPGWASRDALRIWSGGAFSVIHGPRHEPDHGLRYDIRLDRLGPAASDSGPSRSKESDADRFGMERVEGGGCGEPNRAGSIKMHRQGTRRCSQPYHLVPLGHRTALSSAAAHYRGRVGQS